jgi:hypothetical protein
MFDKNERGASIEGIAMAVWENGYSSINEKGLEELRKNVVKDLGFSALGEVDGILVANTPFWDVNGLNY